MLVYINYHYLLSCTIGRTFHVREIVEKKKKKERKGLYLMRSCLYLEQVVEVDDELRVVGGDVRDLTPIHLCDLPAHVTDDQSDAGTSCTGT